MYYCYYFMQNKSFFPILKCLIDPCSEIQQFNARYMFHYKKNKKYCALERVSYSLCNCSECTHSWNLYIAINDLLFWSCSCEVSDFYLKTAKCLTVQHWHSVSFSMQTLSWQLSRGRYFCVIIYTSCQCKIFEVSFSFYLICVGHYTWMLYFYN